MILFYLFATGVLDIGGAPDLRISLRIVEKFRNNPNVIFRAWGRRRFTKKIPEAKNLMTLSL
jgi:hypothetical protein